MSYVRTLASVLALAAFPIVASAQALANPDVTAVEGGTYRIDPAHTQVIFHVSHIGFGDFSGFFHDASGELELSPKSLTATRVDITVPASSVLTTVDKLTGELKDAQWLDAATYPNVTFRSTKITRTGADTADIAGTLALHGLTRPVVLKSRFVGAGVNPIDKTYTAGFEGTFTIKRSEFGMKTYTPLIGDEVRLTITAAFQKRAG